ncbi:hypothetical protein KIPB_011951, partial [Kipferlia bialata]|eukprot:g11951.t1
MSGGSDSDSITVREGDVVAHRAQQFADKHGLPPGVVSPLTRHIQSQLDRLTAEGEREGEREREDGGEREGAELDGTAMGGDGQEGMGPDAYGHTYGTDAGDMYGDVSAETEASDMYSYRQLSPTNVPPPSAFSSTSALYKRHRDMEREGERGRQRGHRAQDARTASGVSRPKTKGGHTEGMGRTQRQRAEREREQVRGGHAHIAVTRLPASPSPTTHRARPSSARPYKAGGSTSSHPDAVQRQREACQRLSSTKMRPIGGDRGGERGGEREGASRQKARRQSDSGAVYDRLARQDPQKRRRQRLASQKEQDDRDRERYTASNIHSSSRHRAREQEREARRRPASACAKPSDPAVFDRLHALAGDRLRRMDERIQHQLETENKDLRQPTLSAVTK